jgi:CRISPR-associated protein Csb1
MYTISLDNVNEFLMDDSEVAALTIRQWLVPTEGKEATIFPPTYPYESGTGYVIDRYPDGTSVCLIDSVGSQANRMEPLFLKSAYRDLVPQVTVKADSRVINLLEAGHRAADAIIRFSTPLGVALHEAFQRYRDQADAEPLAKIAPTSLVFGVWDSRATQVKLPRVVRSVIRAFNVREMHRSAQYTTIAGEILEGEAEVASKGPKAELGLAHVPAVNTVGGVQVFGEIRRDAALNLEAIRALGTSSGDATMRLRRYIFGLALVALTAPMPSALREGCQIVPDPDRAPEYRSVSHQGTRVEIGFDHETALTMARAAAKEFGVGPNLEGEFDSKLVQDVLKLASDDRKKLLRQGPVTAEAVKKALSRKAPKSAQGDS